MIPVDENVVISKDWLLAQMNLMISGKRTLLSMDCKEKNVLGFSYDTGYISALLELQSIINNPPKQTEIEEEDEDA